MYIVIFHSLIFQTICSLKKCYKQRGSRDFFLWKKVIHAVIECSIIHVYLLLFFSYISYHKSLDNEQRPMIHYAIFFYFIIFILYISVEVVVTYILLSLAFVQVWNQCLPRDIGFSVGNECWIYKTKKSSLYHQCILCISIFILFHVFIFFFFIFILHWEVNSCKKSWWVCYICCTVWYASVFSHYKLILKNI